MSDSYDPDTRPLSNDPAVIAAWQERKRAREARLLAEQAFRDRAMQHFGESAQQWKSVSEDLTAIREEMRTGMQAHEQRDEKRFADLEARFEPVKQSIDSNDNRIHWLIGIGVGVVGVVGVVGLYLSLRGTP